MHLRENRKDFSGLIGKHSTERTIVQYDNSEDETAHATVTDDDYPNAPFICFPRRGVLAVVDSPSLSADSAIARLARILAHRQKVFFVAEPLREQFNLSVAVKRFKISEVIFEIFPVNPHTGDLGKRLDDSRKLDHIKKIAGKATASTASPITLNGGFLTAVQQLQKSGHCKVGFRGQTDEGVEVFVPKPKDRRELSDDDEEARDAEYSDLSVEFKGMKTQYPFDERHFSQMRIVVKKLLDHQEDEN